MLIKCFEVGYLETNCYIVSDPVSKKCAVIDPGAGANMLLNYIEENGLNCEYVLLTHTHPDHTGAVEDILLETNAVLHVNKKDCFVNMGMGESFSPKDGTVYYKEGDTIRMGSVVFAVMETPGHSEGSVVLLCTEDGASEPATMFTGDTLFRDSCGRTDFIGGDTEKMMNSLKRLSDVPDNCEVLPGHGFSSDLDREKKFNVYMRAAMSR